MKKLKFIFLPIIIISLLSFVNATCVYDTGLDAIICEPGNTCTSSNCYCNDTIPGAIGSGDICGTSCVYNPDPDILAYDCNPTEYCPTGAGNCLCNGGGINEGDICTPIIASCSIAGITLYSGQSTTVYQASTVSYTGSCGGLYVTCNVIGGVGVLTPSAIGYNFNSCIVTPPPTGSCTTSRGTTIASGSSITGYPTSSVSCGSICGTTTTATCLNGGWSGNANNARYSTCHVNTCGGGGGGGGGYTVCTTNHLFCSSGTRIIASGSYCYGGLLGSTCSTTGNNNTGTLPVGSIAGSTFSNEMNQAYLRAYANGITTMPTIQQANMTGKLIRSHMAKMISAFAILLGDRLPNESLACNFNDIANQSIEMKFYIKLSCQLGLMGQNISNFNPREEVTRAQFGTIMSRLIRGSLHNGGTPYYTSHLNALKLAGIMTQISNPQMKEVRGYVMIMMKRTYEGGFLNN